MDNAFKVSNSTIKSYRNVRETHHFGLRHHQCTFPLPITCFLAGPLQDDSYIINSIVDGVSLMHLLCYCVCNLRNRFIIIGHIFYELSYKCYTRSTCGITVLSLKRAKNETFLLKKVHLLNKIIQLCRDISIY